MKQILVLLLIASISYQYVAKMGVIIWFEVNKDYVVAQLCENRDRPALECNGKCYLKKQLSKVDNDTSQEKKQAEKKEKEPLPEYISCNTVLAHHFVCEENTNTPIICCSNYSYTYLSSVFHPPID